MPCLIFTGHPCAGKSTLAEKFRERALEHSSNSIQKVVIVNEQIACPDKTQLGCYESSYAEKGTRGALKSSFDRAVSSADDTTLVILDSLNYIKGYRYELFCISKAAKERHGVVWVLNDVNIAREWNRQRCQQQQEQQQSSDSDSDTCTYYTDELLQELIQRYEPPDDRNRWDKPLYRVDLRPNDSVTANPELAQNVLSQSVYNMHSLSDAIGGGTVAGAATAPSADATASADAAVKPEVKPATTKKPTFKRAVFKRPAKPAPTGNDTVPEANPQPAATNIPAEDDKEDTSKKVLSLEDRIDEILDSFLGNNNKPLTEGASTRQHVQSDANVLHNVDTVTQQVCSSITAAQNKSTTVTGKLQIVVRDQVLHLECHRRLPLTELRRLRKQYIQWVALHPPENTTERGIAESFLQYIETQR
jgi:protein KTI12